MLTATRQDPPLSPSSCPSPMAKLDLRDLNVFSQLKLDVAQLRATLAGLGEAMTTLKPSSQHAQRSPSRQYALTSPDGTVRLANTHLQGLPTKQEAGDFFALVLDHQAAYAAHYELRGSLPAAEHYVSSSFDYVDEKTKTKYKLSDISFPASSLLAAALAATRDLQRHAEAFGYLGRIELGLVVAHNLIHPSISSAYMLLPEEAVDAIPDPLAGTDLVNLLNIGFDRHGLNAEVTGCISNTTALLLTGAFETPWDQSRCLVSVECGVEFSAAYLQHELPDAGAPRGAIFYCDVGKFHGNCISSKETNFTTVYGIPVTIGDIQLGCQTVQSGSFSLDKLICARYVSEVCRVLLLRDLEHEAPAALWRPYCLSFKACIELRESPQNAAAVLRHYFQWEPSEEEAQRVCQVVSLVFARSAAMVAVVVADVAKRTGRLQPALGGLTVAFTGALVDETYLSQVRESLDRIFHRDTRGLINFTVPRGNFLAQGGAILTALLKQR